MLRTWELNKIQDLQNDSGSRCSMSLTFAFSFPSASVTWTTFDKLHYYFLYVIVMIWSYHNILFLLSISVYIYRYIYVYIYIHMSIYICIHTFIYLNGTAFATLALVAQDILQDVLLWCDSGGLLVQGWPKASRTRFQERWDGNVTWIGRCDICLEDGIWWTLDSRLLKIC